MATNPPISIPPFNNVPAPGSGVKSDWAQQVSHYVTENLARGLVARPVIVNVDQSGIAAATTDLTGFSITVPVVAGRWYEVTWMFMVSQQTATASQSFQCVLDGAGVIIGTLVQAAGSLVIYSGALHFVGGTSVGTIPGIAVGSRIIKLRGSCGAGSMNIASAGVMNGRFSVKDIGSTVAIP